MIANTIGVEQKSLEVCNTSKCEEERDGGDKIHQLKENHTMLFVEPEDKRRLIQSTSANKVLPITDKNQRQILNHKILGNDTIEDIE